MSCDIHRELQSSSKLNEDMDSFIIAGFKRYRNHPFLFFNYKHSFREETS